MTRTGKAATAGQIVVRRLAPGDAAGFSGFLGVFAAAFSEPEIYLHEQPSDGYRDRLLADERFIALAASRGGIIVGALAAYELRKFEQERSEFYIYDLAVAENHRRAGIATGMIRHLQTIAAEGGGHVVFVQADHGDDPAIALYTKLGSPEHVLHFDLPVGSDD